YTAGCAHLLDGRAARPLGSLEIAIGETGEDHQAQNHPSTEMVARGEALDLALKLADRVELGDVIGIPAQEPGDDEIVALAVCGTAIEIGVRQANELTRAVVVPRLDLEIRIQQLQDGVGANRDIAEQLEERANVADTPPENQLPAAGLVNE